MLVAKGGRGGRGNEHFKTARNNAPSFAERGEKGAERWLNIELKLIADVGFIGVPNAGKSTLLASVSNAKPKIGDYPFTTIVPNLGVCDVDGAEDGTGLVIADIPGLLEGAHDGVGLGLAFLRHVQRCRVLVHVLRGDSEDPVGDLVAINQELALFNPKLASKPQVVVVNKIDIPEVQERLDDLIAQIKAKAGHTRVMGISAVTKERTRELMMRVRKLVLSLPRQSDYELFTEEEERVNFESELSENFEILADERFPGQFRVAGEKIERIVEMTNWDYYEAVQRFQRILEAQGIADALRESGAVEGDLVMIGEWDFNYWERKNRWSSDLGLENINPRKRPDQSE
jgi:GTP-binding protein